MAKKILVTGAAGLIGRELVKQLSNLFIVEAIDNNFRYQNLDLSFNCINVNVIEYLQKIQNDYDYIFHMAAINGTKFFYDIPNQIIENNFVTDLHVFKFVSQNPNCKLIYASSSEVVTDTDVFPTPEINDIYIKNIHNPRWSYRLSKILSENYLMNSQINFLIIRFFNIFDKNSGDGHFIKDIVEKISKKDYFLIGCNETRSFCKTDDAVNALIKIFEIVEKDIVNIGSDEEITVYEAANIISEHFNTKIQWNCLPSKNGSALRRKPDLKKLLKYYPDYSPKKFRDAIKDL